VALARLLVLPLRLEGVAIATLAGFLSSTILLYLLSQRAYPIPYRGMRALSLYAFALVLWTFGAHAPVVVRIALLLVYAGVATYLGRRIPPSSDGPVALAMPDPSPTPKEAI
jgi:hypothetical protein